VHHSCEGSFILGQRRCPPLIIAHFGQTAGRTFGLLRVKYHPRSFRSDVIVRKQVSLRSLRLLGSSAVVLGSGSWRLRSEKSEKCLSPACTHCTHSVPITSVCPLSLYTDAGGIEAICRWLSEATPPDGVKKHRASRRDASHLMPLGHCYFAHSPTIAKSYTSKRDTIRFLWARKRSE